MNHDISPAPEKLIRAHKKVARARRALSMRANRFVNKCVAYTEAKGRNAVITGRARMRLVRALENLNALVERERFAE